MRYFAKIIGFIVILVYGYFHFSYASDISSTKHNLSVTGPGPIKAVSETRICEFCHTPHSANPAVPLWNHTLSPRASYTLPTSPTQLTTPSNPPDGDSRLCLSCHDGMVAIGSVINLSGGPTTISMQGTGAGGVMPAGPSNLGGDLSGTHLISIAYNDDLKTQKDNQKCVDGIVFYTLRSPSLITPPVRIRPTQNTFNGNSGYNGNGVQCTSCHDPHDNTNGKFLLVDYFSNSENLCLACHCDTCPCP